MTVVWSLNIIGIDYYDCISSKILHCASYFPLPSRCLEMWQNTTTPVCYITVCTLKMSKKCNLQLLCFMPAIIQHARHTNIERE